MADQITASQSTHQESPSNHADVLISAEDYMLHYAHDFYEWEQGRLVKMSPVSLTHEKIVTYLRNLLDTYFALRPTGQVLGEPFVMRLNSVNSFREPDLQVVLGTNQGQLTDTAMIGPADIVIEVVSPESAERDFGKKLLEYEAGGVQEYWIIDPIRKRCQFNCLTHEKVYQTAPVDQHGHYQTLLLPGLVISVPTLWHDHLPTVVEVVESVRTMLAE